MFHYSLTYQPQEAGSEDVAQNGEVDIIDDNEARKILPYEADDSPFPEVRAVVSPVDDPSLPVNTVRMWVIGIIFTIVSCSLIFFY